MRKEEEFLLEYDKLCRKYGLRLHGCCGSPSFEILKENEFLRWDDNFKEIIYSNSVAYAKGYIKDGIIRRKK